MQQPRRWQVEALDLWLANSHRGVISVATGGGKTLFALMAYSTLKPKPHLLVIVPTEALQDQWIVNISEELQIPEDEIGILTSKSDDSDLREINVVIINSARNMGLSNQMKSKTMLVVDECHRSGSYENAKALTGPWAFTLGLSATPERQFDDGFEKYIAKALGPQIYEYSVQQAIQDGVLTPFQLINVEVPLTSKEKEIHQKLTKSISRLSASAREGDVVSAQKIESLLRNRARNYQNARGRVPVTLQIMENLHGLRTIIFHESIVSVETIAAKLTERNHSVVTYHSKVSPRLRRDNLRLFRKGLVNVLVTCRALDEGLNIPETEVAIIASATSSDRQRIQRLGRVLRPSEGKESALVYTLFATEIEKKRLIEESSEMMDIVTTKWGEVKVTLVDNS